MKVVETRVYTGTVQEGDHYTTPIIVKSETGSGRVIVEYVSDQVLFAGLDGRTVRVTVEVLDESAT